MINNPVLINQILDNLSKVTKEELDMALELVDKEWKEDEEYNAPWWL